MMTQAQTDTRQNSIIEEAQTISLRPDTPVPDGVKVENMRRRGIDQLEISIPHPEAWKDRVRRLFLLGSLVERVATATFAEDHALFVVPGLKPDTSEETLVERRDITAVAVQPGSLSKASCLLVSIGEQKVAIGLGLPIPTLEWLRERIILEVAGLISRPLFNVGRRITRKTSNPDDDFYRHWTPGPNKLISIFLTEFPKKAAELRTSIGEKAWNDAAKHCHWMKSSSAAVGAAQLSELCQRMEIDVLTMDYSKIESLYVHFERELGTVSDVLARTINGSVSPHSSLASTDKPDASDTVSSRLEGRKILLVEDSLVNQEVARFSLEEAGCTTVVASDGIEAVKLFDEDTYDLILMDCQMPNMDGFEATRAIRKVEANRFLTPTPIIALTANALKDDREACVSAGMHDYLSKPYEERDLLEMLRKWLPDDELLAAFGKTPEETKETVAA